ncbi:putative RNA-directed DNA polymerase, eukaryota, reverse transcriptase zinc-binding domain protein [Tanacetum coccineum]
MVAQHLVKESLMRNLLEWDMKAKNGLINTNDILKREEWMMDLNHHEQLHRDDLKQKGRVGWAVEGDENTRFFHSTLKIAMSPFIIAFIKTYWEVIKEDFWNCVKLFESSCGLSNGCNSSFIVLIPKKKDPIGFSDYRPISLIGCVYKVISKLLATRLAKVINSVIGPNQSAFIEGWQILDGCLIASEIIRMAALENHKLLLFKVDFEKAFDSVNWNFLLSIITQMGFGGKWRNWISSCLSSASISVMINGSPSKEFKMERGLRQGDLLSPLLFLIVAEALKIAIIEACNKGVFKAVSLAESSDLKINLSKSRLIGVGVPVRDVEGMASSLGCSHDSLPFIYPGLPVGKRMRFCDGWSVVIDRFRNKLSVGKLKLCRLVGGLLSSSLSLVAFLSAVRLMDFPRLFALTTHKDCNISERWSLMNNAWGWNWCWRFPPRGRANDDLASLLSYIGSLPPLVVERDKWQWALDGSGSYKVFVLESLACPFYERDVEDLDHCIIVCSCVLPIWRKVWSWWNIDLLVVFPSFSVSDIACGSIASVGNSKVGKVLQGVFQISLWAIWKWRNRIVNATTDSIPKIKEEGIFPVIQRLSKTWIAARLSSKPANLDIWISRTFDLFV